MKPVMREFLLRKVKLLQLKMDQLKPLSIERTRQADVPKIAGGGAGGG